jgi:hypothetical protein
MEDKTKANISKRKISKRRKKKIAKKKKLKRPFVLVHLSFITLKTQEFN